MTTDTDIEMLTQVVDSLGVAGAIALLATVIQQQAPDWAEELHDLATAGPLVKP